MSDITIIAKNVTVGNIEIQSLGITIAASDQINLTSQGFSLSEIDQASDLYSEVDSGNIVINDGTSDLSSTEGKDWITLETTQGGTGDHDLDFHTDVPTKPTSGNYVLENQDGTLQWTEFNAVSVRADGLLFRDTPTFNGYLKILGWYNVSDLSIALDSTTPFTATIAGYNSHYVLDISNAVGLPFTIRCEGKIVDEVTGIYTDTFEDITITANGHYQTAKSFIDYGDFSIVEADKSCDVDLYTTTYWDRGNKDFTVTGCRLEWTPVQNNWDIDVGIYKVANNGEKVIIDKVEFHSTDTVKRAGEDLSGKYKRGDYNTFCEGSNMEGLVVEVENQQGIGSILLEVKFDAS
jgi:hypothetical protein